MPFFSFDHPPMVKKMFVRSMLVVFVLNLVLAIGFILLDWVNPLVAHAAPLPMTISLVSGPSFVNDSNNCANSGPRAAYIVFRLTNTGGSTLTNLQAGLSGLDANFQLAGGQVITQYIGSLASGASRDVYWYVSYPIMAPCSTTSAKTFTVNVIDGAANSATGTGTVTAGPFISASAGGDLVSSLIGPGYVLGQVIPYTVSYTYGNLNNRPLAFQPAGNLNFDARCFQLTSAQVISLTAGSWTGITIGSADLYYSSVNAPSGTTNDVTVRYSILYLCNSVSTTAYPFAWAQSGGQDKYTSNYSVTQFISTFPAGSNPFTMSKSVTPKILGPSGGVVTYTVKITNTSPYNSQFDSITDSLTTNLSNAIYGGIVTPDSQITSGNSSQIPNPGATGTLHWVGQPQGYYSVPAGSTITLVYTETLSGGSGRYTNTVTANSGNSPIVPAQAVVGVNDPTTVTLSTFAANSDGFQVLGESGSQLMWGFGLIVGIAIVVGLLKVFRK